MEYFNRDIFIRQIRKDFKVFQQKINSQPEKVFEKAKETVLGNRIINVKQSCEQILQEIISKSEKFGSILSRGNNSTVKPESPARKRRKKCESEFKKR